MTAFDYRLLPSMIDRSLALHGVDYSPISAEELFAYDARQPRSATTVIAPPD
jgi:hypothetical protein